jgi:leucyl-tRNA synthetase
VKVPAAADKHAIEAAALASPEFAKFSEGKPAKKIVMPPGRQLINVVV